MSTAKNLTKEPPRSPRERIGGYAILARMADKGRASLRGNVGEYHFDCPLDNMLFGFKGVKGDDVKEQLQAGATDEQIATWLDANGTPKSPEEIKAWSDDITAARPYDDPESRAWFSDECAKLGLDPAKTTLFEWLETDDRVTFGK
jgi:hypothetical protein